MTHNLRPTPDALWWTCTRCDVHVAHKENANRYPCDPPSTPPTFGCCRHCRHGGGLRMHGAPCPWCGVEEEM